MLFLKQEIDDPDSTLLSNAADEETNSKSGMGDDGFEVVTLESDYQVIRCIIKLKVAHTINYIRIMSEK